MKKIFALALLLASQVFAVTASDLFNQNTGSSQAIATYSTNWSVVEGGFQIPTGNLSEYRSSVALNNCARYSGATWSGDQESIVKVKAGWLTGGYFAGPSARAQSGAATYYAIAANSSAYYLKKIVAGVAADLAANIPITLAGGESLKLTVQTSGSNCQLFVYKNTTAAPTTWTQVGSTVTDNGSVNGAVITGGAPGIFGYGDVSASGFGGGDWQASDLGGGGGGTPAYRSTLLGVGK